MGAGLAADGNAEAFRRRRATEIKHGRVSMLACLGYITPEYAKFSGDLSPSQAIKFTDVPNGLGAFSKVPVSGWVQMFPFCGLCETQLFGDQNDDSRAPGDFANAGILGVPTGLTTVKSTYTMAESEQKKRKLSAEIANGRLAMMAIIGMFFQDGLTGSAWGDWALYTASPLRAFENEHAVKPALCSECSGVCCGDCHPR